MELGTVISFMETPSTREFSFVVTNGKARKGTFVELPTQEGTLIANIADVYRGNRYFERAESVSEYEKNASSFLENFPAAEWEFEVAKCDVHGFFQGERLSRCSRPPSPGQRVHEIDPELLKKFLGFTPEGILLGKVLNHDVDVRVDLNRLLQKHVALLGTSGSGKSHASAVLLEELLSRTKEQGRMAVIAIDSHGDYTGFAAHDSPLKERVTVVKGERIRIATSRYSAKKFSEILPEITGTAERELSKILRQLEESTQAEGGHYGLEDIISAINAAELKENVKAPLLAWMEDLRGLRLFGQADYPSLRKTVQPGHLVVIDLSDVIDARKKQIIVADLARKAFYGRRKSKLPPFLLLVEEAHNFAREKSSHKEALARGIIEMIAREGRKFGACLCLVSQRPVQLSTTALSQCNSFVIFRITNPYDVDHVKQSCEAITDQASKDITTLKVGEAILVGEALNVPLFMRVRERRTPKGDKGLALDKLAKTYDSKISELSNADIEAFM